MPDPVSPADTPKNPGATIAEVLLLTEGYLNDGYGESDLRERLAKARPALAALLAVGERDKAEIARLRGDLTMLRDAWNAHMESCPIHAALPDLPAPTWDYLERWRNAPSDTAPGGDA